MVSRRQMLKISALGTASFAAPLAYSASNTATGDRAPEGDALRLPGDDALRLEQANPTDPKKGAGMMGFSRDTAYTPGTAGLH